MEVAFEWGIWPWGVMGYPDFPGEALNGCDIGVHVTLINELGYLSGKSLIRTS